MHFIVSHWFVPAITLIVAGLFGAWKMKGGQLLFKSKSTDDGTTKLFKLIFEMGWMAGSLVVAFFASAASAIWLVIALIAFLAGVR